MIHETIFAALSVGVPALGGRIYPNTAPDQPQTPYAVYSRVANPPETCLDGAQPIQNTRLQIDIYDKTYNGVQTSAQAVINIMTGAPINAVQLMDQDQWEADVKLHRVIHDYSVWHYQVD